MGESLAIKSKENLGDKLHKKLFPDNRWTGDYKQWEYPAVFNWLKKINATKVMDFGCGFSPFPQYLTGHGFEVWGVDDDSGGYIHRFPFEAIGSENPDVNYHIGSIFDLDEKFDAIISCSVLEHLEDEDERIKIYQRMKEMLNPSGKVCHIADYFFPKKMKWKKPGREVNFATLADAFGVPYDPRMCPGADGFDFEKIRPDIDFMFPNNFEARIMVAHNI